MRPGIWCCSGTFRAFLTEHAQAISARMQAAKAAAASAAPAPAKPSGSMPPPAPRAPKPAWAAAAPAASPAAARTMMAPPAPVPVATTHAANLAQGIVLSGASTLFHNRCPSGHYACSKFSTSYCAVRRINTVSGRMRTNTIMISFMLLYHFQDYRSTRRVFQLVLAFKFVNTRQSKFRQEDGSYLRVALNVETMWLSL